MMVTALGPTVWIAVGEAEIDMIVERAARPLDVVDGLDGPAFDTPPRAMPTPAPLAMPLQEF